MLVLQDTAKTYVQQKNTIKIGHLGWTNIEDLYEGKNNSETQIRELQNLINRQSYTGNRQGDATCVTTRLFKYYSDLDDLKTYKTEIEKLRHLRQIINMGGGLREPYYISFWKTEVDKALSDFMLTGMEVDFAQWTTRLVNDESFNCCYWQQMFWQASP